MKRSESQSLYKALPGQYISYELSAIEKSQLPREKAVIKISFWNKKDIDPNEIYIPKIVNQVCSNLIDFIHAGQEDQGASVEIDGPIMSLITSEAKSRVRFVQAKVNNNPFSKEEMAQIYGHINPKMFYCEKCGKIKILEKDSDVKNMFCHNRKMMQYERVWICGCGESLPIDNFDIKEGDRYFASDPNEVTGGNNQKRRLQRKCPKCQTLMTLVNATDNQAFYPRAITTIKLYNNNYAKLCEYDEGCKLILEKHKHEITQEDFERECERILEEKSNNEFGSDLDNLDGEDFMNKLLGDINIIKPEEPEPADKEIIYKVLEYDTLEEKKVTDLEEAIKKAISLNKIQNGDQVHELARKMKIKDIYSVSDIEIINTAYGYTRRYQSPEGKLNNADILKLRAFTEKNNPGVPIFYNVRTKSEGIVIDIDPKEMFRHVYAILSNKFRIKNLKDESEIKNWFLDKNNIDPDLIEPYSDIKQSGTLKAEATKITYTILHTLSHVAIQSISKYSGIDKDSLTEMVFPNLCSILIYASTNQAIVLGAITNMFDKQIDDLLQSIYNDTKICSFDPICMDTTNGSCLACTYLSEVACEHFNKDLSRKYLYGYHNKNENIKGFWEDNANGNNASE